MPRNEPPVGLSVDICNCTALRKAARRTGILYDRVLSRAHLTSVQYAILAELRRQAKQGLNLHRLARVMVMERSALGRHLRLLEGKGWVMLKAPEGDLRQRVVVLSMAGRRKLQSAKPLWRRAQEDFERALGRDDAQNLRRLLASAKSVPL